MIKKKKKDYSNKVVRRQPFEKEACMEEQQQRDFTFCSHGNTRQNRFQITRQIKGASTHLHKTVKDVSVNKIQSQQIMQKKNLSLCRKMEQHKFKIKESHVFFYHRGRMKQSLELEDFEMH